MFHVVVANAEETLPASMLKSVESVLYHHPNALVIVHYLNSQRELHEDLKVLQATRTWLQLMLSDF